MRVRLVYLVRRGKKKEKVSTRKRNRELEDLKQP